MIKDRLQSRAILAFIDSRDSIPSASGRRMFQKLLFSLVPSFLQSRLSPSPSPSKSKPSRLRPTAYLDGLRGVASFIVFMGHYTEENLGWWTEPYGLYESGAASSPMQLPFLRVLYSARPMVHIFFLISGYVLAIKPLQQIHAQQYAALSSTLSSSVFRRGVRLFVPSIATLFIMCLAVHFGISDDRYATRLATLSDQLTDWRYAAWDVVWASWFITDLQFPNPPYNPALWTIPVEFAQSLLLFMVILGLSRCVVNARLLILAVIIGFCFYSGELYSIEFLGGMFIAEVTLLQDRSLSSGGSTPSELPKFVPEERPTWMGMTSTTTGKLVQAFWIANAACGLYIASWTNNHVDELWGLSYLQAHTPEPFDGQRIWFCLGAFQIVAACTQVRALQSLFNNPVAQYLGHISYALYLTHNMCLRILEPMLVPILDSIFPKDTFIGRHLSWVAGMALYLPVIITVADLFWRAVDQPTVRFARWLEEKCIVGVKEVKSNRL
jgi:peptidoglycan/LPS O-acetylase OafA/YrhL